MQEEVDDLRTTVAAVRAQARRYTDEKCMAMNLVVS